MNNADRNTMFNAWLSYYPKGKTRRTKNAIEDFERVLSGKHPNHIGIKGAGIKTLVESIRNLNESGS